MAIQKMSLLFLFLHVQIYSFIYHLEVLRKWDKPLNRYHYVVGCGDWHDKLDQSTQLHRQKLEQFIRAANPATTKLIVEDLSTMHAGSPAFCRSFSVDTRGGVLGGLAQVCCESKLSVENIEHRYCRVASVGPLLHHPKKDLKTSRPTCAIQVADVLAEINQSASLLFDSLHPDCFRWKNKVTGSVKKLTKDLHLDQHQENTMADYVSMHVEPNKRFDLFKTLLIFDSALLDLKIVNAVLHSQDKKTVVVVAGGTHIIHAADMLQKSGYKKMYVSPVHYKNEYDLKRCVGAPVVKNKYCAKPEPISISLLEQYVRRY